MRASSVQVSARTHVTVGLSSDKEDIAIALPAVRVDAQTSWQGKFGRSSSGAMVIDRKEPLRVEAGKEVALIEGPGKRDTRGYKVGTVCAQRPRKRAARALGSAAQQQRIRYRYRRSDEVACAGEHSSGSVAYA